MERDGSRWRKFGTPGNSLVNSDDLHVEVVSATRTGRRQTVYNLEVEGSHTYFVGSTSVLVHNECRPGNAGGAASRRLSYANRVFNNRIISPSTRFLDGAGQMHGALQTVQTVLPTTAQIPIAIVNARSARETTELALALPVYVGASGASTSVLLAGASTSASAIATATGSTTVAAGGTMLGSTATTVAVATAPAVVITVVAAPAIVAAGASIR